MQKRKYAGTWTAIITPFQSDGNLDEENLRKIVRRQIENGVTGVVPIGTTGESPTISEAEVERIFEIVIEEAGMPGTAGKMMVMAGTGSNCTKKAVEHTKAAKKAGADCCLVVTPYYNKPTQEGIRQHFMAVAEVGLPVIVYNIKGRTGVNIQTDTLMEIAKHPSVVGVKEASGDLAQMKEVLEQRSDDFTVLSGDDGLTLDLIKMGGDGVVSVASNLVPAKVSEMVEYALAGNFEEAWKINEYLASLFSEIFVETNPIPVKYIASRMGLCELIYRLPMCAPSAKARELLSATIKNYNLA
ncbi:4-hydroxy-tetrahydrodipicolinate synthase [Candidatus Peregrinibacteria bacterium]|nr:4-hydroxy-tetrahydrodipicolinate synthase [Candidatus Peregrinibacteria bacterium]